MHSSIYVSSSKCVQLVRADALPSRAASRTIRPPRAGPRPGELALIGGAIIGVVCAPGRRTDSGLPSQKSASVRGGSATPGRVWNTACAAGERLYRSMGGSGPHWVQLETVMSPLLPGPMGEVRVGLAVCAYIV